jgi:Domain of unknown function (DUF5605)/Domain of unknown function (DUF5060)/Protein of unknown function (DUF4038)
MRIYRWLLFSMLILQALNATSLVQNIEIKQYEIFELNLKGSFTGNAFTDINFSASFRQRNRVIEQEGFYDGNGIFTLRFMPDSLGEWTYSTQSNLTDLNGKEGKFLCTAAEKNIHGPVYVHNSFNFAYADGTPFYPVGTTCYQWVFQGDPEKTLETLSKNAFNKIRMCVFPKNYDVYINNEPVLYPFEGSKEKGWNFNNFNPAYFQFFEDKISKLMKLGIEADIILFHPYDARKWNFDKMSQEQREHYINYIVARLSAYRNVWWSLANEFEFLGISDKDWESLFHIIEAKDPYHHLRSIHNGMRWFDVSKPYITHLSVQGTDFFHIQEWREKYKKPVIIDECVYEGDLPNDWGNLTAEEMTSRFWQVYCRGGYCTHGETYIHPQNILWWSKGGVLYGKSPERIAFLKKIMEESPAEGVYPYHSPWNKLMYLVKDNEYYLYYFGNTQQKSIKLDFSKDVKFKVEIIDTWDMTITPVDGFFSGHCEVPMPGKPWMALRALAIK